MTKILSGIQPANETIAKIKLEIIKNKYQIKLAIILIGDDSASKIYINHKMKKCQQVNIATELITFPSDVALQTILDKINVLNNTKTITGILLQLPLPQHLKAQEQLILNAISALKDVDGLNYLNIIQRKINENGIIPATPKGILNLMKYYNISLNNKNICLIGKSVIVGQPLAIELHNLGSNYVCVDKDTDPIAKKNSIKNADIVISATGIKHFINDKTQVKKDVVLIDVGICKTKTKKIYGDINFDNLLNYASAITPVPGGIGPMTIAALLENLLIIYKW